MSHKTTAAALLLIAPCFCPQYTEKQEEKLKKELEGTEDFKESWQKEFARDWEEITGILQMYMYKPEDYEKA